MCASWCKIDPLTGVLGPGEVIVLTFTVYIDNNALKQISPSRELEVTKIPFFKFVDELLELLKLLDFKIDVTYLPL